MAFDNPRPSSQPEGSTAMVVAKDNLILLDKLSVSDENTILNRKGQPRKTFAGVGQDVQVVIDGITQDGQEAIANAVYAIGFQPKGLFQVGAVVDSAQDKLAYNDEEYNTTIGPFPYTVTGATPTLDPAPWFNVTLEKRKTAAIALNVPLADMTYGLPGEVVTPYFYITAQEKTYSVPAGAIGKTIDSVVGGTLNTVEVGGPYQLTLPNDITIQNTSEIQNMSFSGAGQKVSWLGYYSASDGGGNWGVIKKGAHTADGLSIFTINIDTYIEANTKGRSLNVRKGGAVGDGVENDSIVFSNVAAVTGGAITVPNGSFLIEDVVLGESVTQLRGYGLSSKLVIAEATTGLLVGNPSPVDTKDYWKVQIKDVHIYSDFVTQGTIGINIDGGTNCLLKNIYYTKTDKVVNQVLMSGSTLKNVSNSNIEDGATDCNYIVYCNSDKRQNDNKYKNFVARAKVTHLYLGLSNTTTGQHDGLNIQNNIFFPNSTDSPEPMVYITRAIWTVITGNKFFIASGASLDINFAAINVTIANNQFAYPGRGVSSVPAIKVISGAGSTSTAFGNIDIGNNVITQPSGSAIVVKGIRDVTITDNTITGVASNSFIATPAFTVDAITVSIAREVAMSGNNISKTRDGINSTNPDRGWRYDIYIASTVTNSIINHSNNMANISTVFVEHGATVKLLPEAPRVTNTRTELNTQSAINPYGTTGWTDVALPVTIIRDGATPNPIYGSTNDPLKLTFTSGGVSATKKGSTSTTAGESVSIQFTAKAAIVGTYFVKITVGGVDYVSEMLVTTTWQDYFFTLPAPAPAGFSEIGFQKNSGGGDLWIAGLADHNLNGVIDTIRRVADYGGAAPTAGYWHAGSVVYNESPAAAGFFGFINVAEGLPGTWKTFGAITV